MNNNSDISGQLNRVLPDIQATLTLATNLTTNNGLVFTANVSNSSLIGANGNNITVTILNNTSSNASSIAVNGTNITINLAAGSNITTNSTAASILGLFQANNAATALVNVALEPGFNGNGNMATLPRTNLSGGTNVVSTLDTNGNNVTLSASLSGPGGIVKAGNGVLTLTGTNTFTGATSVSAGTLTLGNSLALENSTLTLLSTGGGSLNFSNLGSVTLGGLAGNATLDLSNNLNGQVNLIVGQNNFDTFFNGTISDTHNLHGSVTKIGSGNLTLATPNTYNGTTAINGGAVVFNANNNFGVNPDVSINNATLTWAQNSNTDVSSALDQTTGIGSGNVAFNINGNDVTIAAKALAGNGSLVVNGNGGILTIASGLGNTTYVGNTVINSGTLAYGNVTASGGNLAAAIINNSSLYFNEAGGATFTGAISGNGNISVNPGIAAANSTTLAPANSNLNLRAATGGTASNGITVNYINPEANSQPLSFTVTGTGASTVVNVFLATDGNGTAANTSTVLGSNADLTFTANATGKFGSAGNAVSITYVNTGGTTARSIVTVGNAITVTLGTTGGVVNATETAANISAAINADPNASLLVTTALAPSSTGTGLVSALGAFNLSGGLDPNIISTASNILSAINSNATTNAVLSASLGSNSTGSGNVSTGSFTLGGGVNGASNALTISGPNTFGGQVYMNAGTLTLGNSASLQNATVNINNGGGSLSFGTLTGATLGGITGNGNLTLGNTLSAPVALTVGQGNASSAFSGIITGANASLTTSFGTSNSNLLITANTSNASISGGNAVIANNITVHYVAGVGNNVPTTASVTGNAVVITLGTNGSGVVSATAANVISAINANGTVAALVTAANTGGSNGNGIVSALPTTNLTGGGAGSLTKLGSGLLALTGINTFTGGVVIDSGLVNFNSARSFGNGTTNATLATGLVDSNSGITYTANALGTPSNNITVTYTTGTNNLHSSTLTITGNSIVVNLSNTNGTSNATAAQIISLINGNATANAMLTAANTTGSAGSGTVATLNPTFLSGGAYSLTLLGGGIQWAANTTTDISNILNPNMGTGPTNDINTFDTNSNNVILATPLTGVAGISRTGAGSLTLTGNNTFVGPTFNQSGGTLQLGNGTLPGFLVNSALTNLGTLKFSEPLDLLYSQVLSGTGSVTQAGQNVSGIYVATTGNIANGSALTYTATTANPGTAGAAVSITYVNGTGANAVTSANVTGTSILVTLGTDGTGTVNATAAQVLSAVLANSSVTALVTPNLAAGSNGTGVVAAVSATNLAPPQYFLKTGQAVPGTALTYLATPANAGTQGGNITIAYVNGVGNSLATTASVTGTAITVTLGTNATGVVNATAAQVLAALQANGSVTALVTPGLTAGSNGTGTVSALAATGLTAPFTNLILTGANTYTGTTTISTGTLVIANPLALQDTTLNYNTTTSGVLAFGFANSTVNLPITSANIGILNGNADLALVNNTGGGVALNLGGLNTTMTYTGNLTGPGSLVKIGSATLNIGGNLSSYSGGTIINSGTIAFTASNNTFTNFGTGAITLNGGTLTWPSGSLFDVTVQGLILGNTANSNLNYATGSNMTLTQPISGLGANSGVTFGSNNSGKLIILTANSTFLGTANVGNNTTLQLGDGATGIGSVAGAINLTAPVVGGNNGNSTATMGVASNLIFNINKATNGNATYVYNGNITGSGNLTNSGSDDISLGGVNTFIETQVIDANGTVLTNGGLVTIGSGAGNIILTTSNALEGATYVANSAIAGHLIFDAAAGQQISLGGLTGNANIALLDDTSPTPLPVSLTVGLNNVSTTYTGILSGAGSSVSKGGTGSITLVGAQTYTGSTLINQGGIQLGNGTNNGSLASSLITPSGGANLTFDEAAGIFYVNATISGSAGQVIQNSVAGSTLVLTNPANSYSGNTTITNGSAVQLGTGTSAVSDGAIGGAINLTNATSKMIFDQSTNQVFPFSINGTGILIQNGGATSLANVTTGSGASGVSIVANFGNSSVTGTLGNNNISIHYVNGSGNNVATTASVTGNAITVTLGTNGSGVVNATAAQVVSALAANPTSASLVNAYLTGAGTGTVSAQAATFLTGGGTYTPASLTLTATSTVANLAFNTTGVSASAPGALIIGSPLALEGANITGYNTGGNIGNLSFISNAAAVALGVPNVTTATIGGLNGNKTLDISNITLTVGGLGIVNGNIVTTNISSTYSGLLTSTSGPASLIKIGSGTFTLAGGNSLVNGTSTFSTSSAGTPAPSNVSVTNGTLALGNTTTWGMVMGNIVVTSANVANGSIGFVSFAEPASMTYGNVVSGNGNVTQNVTNTLTFTGAETYTGNTTVSLGTLQIGNGVVGSVAAASAISVATGANVNFDEGADVTIANAINGGGNVFILQQNQGNGGTGTLTLSSTNTNTGGTFVGQGATLVLGSNTALQNSTLTMTVGNASANGSINFGNLTNATIGEISGNQNLALTSTAGAVVLTVGNNTATSTYSGNLTGVNPGSDFFKVNTGTLNLNGTLSEIGNITSNGTLNIGGNIQIGNVSNPGSLTVNNGTVTLTGTNNTYTGGTTINSTGIAAFNLASSFGTGQIVINNGTLQWNAANLDISPLLTNAINSGNVTFTSTTAQTLNSTIGGSGNLIVTDAAGMTFGGANTYNGTTNITTGTLIINNVNALAGTTLNYIPSAGTIQFTSNITSVNIGALNLTSNLALTNTLGQSMTLTEGGNGQSTTMSSVLSGSTVNSIGNLTKTGAGLLILSGNNTYNGTTTITGGEIQFSNPGNYTTYLANSPTNFGPQPNIVLNGGGLQWGAGISQDIASNISISGTNSLDTIDTNANNVALLSRPLSGTGVLVKNGGGTLTLASTEATAASPMRRIISARRLSSGAHSSWATAAPALAPSRVTSPITPP